MDLTSHSESLLAQYIEWAREPGWREYVWRRVKDMAREPHGLYSDFPERLTAALNPPKEKPDVRTGESDASRVPQRQRAPRTAR